MELIEMLTSQLGITDEKATGGAGLIFNLAKEKLGSGEFDSIAKLVPGIENMMGSAPEAGGLAGALGGLASAFGGDSASKLGNLATLVGGFKELDLDSDMIASFGKVIMSFIESQGDDSVKAILDKVVASLK